jgi:hypothetical protein
MKALLVVLLVARVAHADDTFEAKAANAQRVPRLENIVWAFTAACSEGDDTEQRQCRVVRDRRVAELAGATLLVDADHDAFAIGPWNAQRKSVPLTVTACIRCGGVEVDGKTWFLVGSGFKLEGGNVHATMLGETSRAFIDEAAEKKVAQVLGNARVQLLIKLPAKPKWSEGGKQGLAFDVLGWRVISACDGGIVMASPTSAPVEPDKKACVPIASTKPADDSPKLDALSMTAIKDALKPVVAAANMCFNQFKVTGTAKLRFTVNGDGTVAKYEQQGDFVGTPTGECIDKSIEKAQFPRTKKDTTSFTYPVQLR